MINEERVNLEVAAQNYLDHLEDLDSLEDDDYDYEHDVFEQAMMYIKGIDIFEEVNKLIDERDKRLYDDV